MPRPYNWTYFNLTVGAIQLGPQTISISPPLSPHKTLKLCLKLWKSLFMYPFWNLLKTPVARLANGEFLETPSCPSGAIFHEAQAGAVKAAFAHRFT